MIYIDNSVSQFQIFDDQISTSNNILNNELEVEEAIQIRKWLPNARSTDRDGDIFLNRFFIIEFQTLKNSIEKTIEKFNLLESVAFAEGIPFIELSFQPNDEYWQALYGLRQVKADSAFSLFDIESEEYPGIMLSGEIVVGIVDGGLMWNHPDLFDNVWRNLGEDADGDGMVLELIDNEWVFDSGDINGLDDDNDGYIDNFVGYDVTFNDNNPIPNNNSIAHGTMVAGCVSATTNNEIGISSVGFSVKLMGINSGDNSGQYITTGYEGLLAAAQMGADIINLSWGNSSYVESYQNVINAVYNQYNPIIVAAAGNYGVNEPHYPASYNHVLSVTSTSQNNSFSCWANFHETVDLAAPGDDIWCTSTQNTSGGYYEPVDGTSFSSPTVAGALALLKSIYPNSDNEFLISKILSSANYFEDMNSDCSGEDLSGFLGAGQLNIYDAIIDRGPVELFVNNVTVLTESGLLVPGDTAEVIVNLYNEIGYTPLANILATLSVDDTLISILNNQFIFNEIVSSGSEFEAHFTIASSGEMIFGDINFNLNLTADLSGNFPSALHFEPYELETEVFIPFGINQEGYPIDDKNIKHSPLFIDLYGNSLPQIYFGSDSSMNGTWISGLNVFGFPSELDGKITTTSAAGDLDGDGDRELVFGSNDGTLYALNKDASQFLSYPQSNTIVGYPVLNDVDSSGFLNIIFVSSNDTSSMLYVIDHLGEDLSGFPVLLSGASLFGPAVADANHNGSSDIILATVNGLVYSYNNSGEINQGFPLSISDSIQCPVSLTDLDGDHDLEIIVGDESGTVYVIDHNSSLISSFSADESVRSGIVIADLNQNGSMELLFSDISQNIYVWDPTQDSELIGWPVHLDNGDLSEPIIVDLDNDLDLEIILTTTAGSVFILHHDGLLYQNFPYISQDSIHCSPAVGDLDMDGDYEIIIGSESGLKVLDISEDGGNQYSWKSYRGNSYRDGFFNQNLSYMSIKKNLVPLEFTLGNNYPNPFNPITRFNYSLSENANVKIIVYDINGREIKVLVNDTESAGNKSTIWDGTNNFGEHVSTGLYFYKIQAADFVKTKKMVLLK